MKFQSTAYVAVFIFAASALPAPGQESDPGYVPASSDPEHLVVVNDVLLFEAEDGVHGRELWTYDAATKKAAMVRDITPGPNGTRMSDFAVCGDAAYFAVDRRGRGRELWVTDGSESGTRLVRAFEFGPEKGFRGAIGSVGDRTFICVQGDFAPRLWITDGTTDGTKPFTSPAYELDRPEGCVLGKALLVPLVKTTQESADRQPGLWRADIETGEVHELRPFTEGPIRFFSANDIAYFVASTQDTGWELWKTDGTADGTVLVENITGDDQSSSPDENVLYHGELFFGAWREDIGRELWRYNPNTETLTPVDLFSGAASGDPYAFQPSGYLYFVATDRQFGKELWRTDGTAEGTFRVSDTRPGPAHGEPYSIVPFNDGVMFSAHNDQIGEELWYSNGTPDSTVLVMDIAPGPMSSSPYESAVYAGHVYFAATHPLYGRELWYTSGKPDGTHLVVDINDDQSINPPSHPDHVTPCGTFLFFVANDLEHGVELWRSDGTGEGTQMVLDIFPGRPGSHPHNLVAAGSILYFCADDGANGVELWRSDGSSEGTALVADLAFPNASSSPRELTPFGDELLFVATHPQYGEELFITEPAGARLVCDIRPESPSSHPRELVFWQGYVYFRANDGVHGEELWRTDGTRQGTTMVKDIVTVPNRGAQVHSMVGHRDGLYFSADDGFRGSELWKVPSEIKHTELVADILRGRDLAIPDE